MFPIDLSFLSSLLDSYLLVIFSYSWFSASETEGEREQVDGSINGPEINCLIWRTEAERQFLSPASREETETGQKL